MSIRWLDPCRGPYLKPKILHDFINCIFCKEEQNYVLDFFSETLPGDQSDRSLQRMLITHLHHRFLISYSELHWSVEGKFLHRGQCSLQAQQVFSYAVFWYGPLQITGQTQRFLFGFFPLSREWLLMVTRSIWRLISIQAEQPRDSLSAMAKVDDIKKDIGYKYNPCSGPTPKNT